MAIEISRSDVNEATVFLETLLTQNIPNGRFSQGTALRDLTINALAFIFAQLRKDNKSVQAMQSLLTAQTIATTDPDIDRAVSNAVNAILSNWFITRNAGAFARGLLTIYVSRKQDYLIPGNNRFLFDRSRAYYPDVTDPTITSIINSADLLPVIDADGNVTSYAFQLRVVAARTGVSYNVDPTTWLAGGQFSPFVQKIISTDKFDGGLTLETTSQMIERSETAITVRNLINVRSVSTVLREKFSGIRGLVTIGMGDPEMQRDLKIETASGIDLHVGGHYDIYVDLPRTQTTFQGKLGGLYTRPDNIVNVFRDSSIPNWTLTDVRIGDIIKITDGLPDSPRDYVIREIFLSELRASPNNPFFKATDETATYVDYYIYRPVFGPDIQILPTIGVNTLGETSKRILTANRLTLPGGAHYQILDVAVIDPDAGDTNISDDDGFVHFTERVPDPPVILGPPDGLQYQVINNDPTTAQSMIQFEELVLPAVYNEKTVRVTYETVVGMGAIHDFTRDRFERVLAGNPLVKAHTPVYLTMEIGYRAKATATALPNETTMNTAVVDLINNFDAEDVIDVSDIIEAIRQADANVGIVFPFTITYRLIVPDGRELEYQTNDIVDLDPSRLQVNPAWTNNQLPNPLALGISDRTVRYRATPSGITFTAQ